MSVKLITATDNRGGIGYKNKLPWHDKDEIDHFRNTTLYHTVVMGWSTFVSLAHQPLLHRKNIVIVNPNKPLTFDDPVISARISKYLANKILVFMTFEQCLKEIRDHPIDTYFIIGGAKTYTKFAPYVDEIIWSKGNFEVECDTFYQPDLQGFKQTKEVYLNDLFTTYYYQRNKDT